MKYRRKPVVVEATQVKKHEFVTLKNGKKIIAEPGMFIVADADGGKSVFAEAEFLKEYEPLDGQLLPPGKRYGMWAEPDKVSK